MSSSTERSPIQRIVWYWPWTVLDLALVPAIWHVLEFPSDIDPENPEVIRPTFSRQPPPAYRLAEPGETIDHIAVYLSAGAILIAARGLLRCRGAGRGIGLWPAALGLALGAFWYASTPGPTLDGWHGLGWRAIADPWAPGALRLTLVGTAVGLVVVIARSILIARGHLAGFWHRGCDRGNLGLLAAALILVGLRQGEIPGIEPVGYWPRWAFDWGLLAFDLALIRAMAPDPNQALNSHPSGFDGRGLIRLGMYGIAWLVLVAGGRAIEWYHRPLGRLKAVVSGKIYISAMPDYRGLELAHRRHHFKTIINLFPEDTPLQSPHLPDELRFAREHGIRYVANPNNPLEADSFMDKTLTLAQDPDAWPILVHCHGCYDRTPAWVGIYRFVVQGRPLDEIMREIEQHRGSRPKASVTLLYNRVLPAYGLERYALDPTAQLLRRCAAGATASPCDRMPIERGSSPPRSDRIGDRDGALRREIDANERHQCSSS